MTGCQNFLIFFLTCFTKLKTAAVHNQFWNYLEAFAITLLLIYETKRYLLALIAGFIAFCAFYFAYATDNQNFEFSVVAVLNALRKAAQIYLLAYLAAVVLYTATKKISKRSEPNIEPAHK